MKKIKDISLGILGIRYVEYDCPYGWAPGKCPMVYDCWANAEKNRDKGSDCIYTKKSK